MLWVLEIEPEFALYWGGGGYPHNFYKIYLVLACINTIGKRFFGLSVKLAILYCQHLMKISVTKW